MRFSLFFIIVFIAGPGLGPVQAKMLFTLVATKLPWPGRIKSELVFLNASGGVQTLFLAGGYQLLGGIAPSSLTDVWSSTDYGLTWNKTEGKGPTGYPAYNFCTDRTNGFTYAINDNLNYGGHRGVLPLWHNQHFQGWNSIIPEATNPTTFLDRARFSCVATSQHRLYYLLGVNATTYGTGFDQFYTDIWYSHDEGANWYLQKGRIGFTPRVNAIVKVHENNKFLHADIVYVMAGEHLVENQPIQYTDIWASSDQGVSWSMITTKFPWSSYSTFDQTVEITKDGIIITSVSALNGNFHSEVWSSLDGGLTWGICNRAAEYGARKAPGVAWNVHGHMYVVAGYTLPGIEVYAFDVWKSDISFHNITSVAHACDLSPPLDGAGLRKWPPLGD